MERIKFVIYLVILIAIIYLVYRHRKTGTRD